MKPNVKRDLIAHLTVKVNYILISAKCTPLRRKDKKSEQTKRERKRVECNKDQIRTWKDVLIISLVSQSVPRKARLDKYSLTSQPAPICASFLENCLDIIASSRIYSVKWDVKAIVKSHKSHYSSALSIMSTLAALFERFPIMLCARAF